MYQWRFIKAILNPRNYLLLLYILLSDSAIYCIGEYLLKPAFELENHYLGLYLLAANFVLTFILTSSIGEFILLTISFKRKNLYRIKQDQNQDVEISRFLKLFNEVHEKSMLKSSLTPKKFKIYINDDAQLNACIIGISTLVVNKGILSLSDDQIKGVISHEFSHSINADSLLSLAKYSANAILTLVVYFILSLIFMLSIAFGLASRRILTFIANIVFGKILRFIIKSVLMLWIFIGTLCELATSRSNEYKADSYSIELGYSNGLIEALRIIDSSDRQKSSIFDNLMSSHPYTKDRILRLENIYVTNKELLLDNKK